MNWLKRIKMRWQLIRQGRVLRELAQAAARRQHEKPGVQAPIQLELGFQLHQNGSVYQIRRAGSVERIDNPDLVSRVHREYHDLYRMAVDARFQGGPPITSKTAN